MKILLIFAAALLGFGGSEFDAAHRLIKPSAGEALFKDVDWHTGVWGARRRAAAEGKPIFIWAGNGGGPIGVC